MLALGAQAAADPQPADSMRSQATGLSAEAVTPDQPRALRIAAPTGPTAVGTYLSLATAMYSWTGQWNDMVSVITMTQTGSKVTGTYPHHQGRLEGTVSGSVLSGDWIEFDNNGTFIFTLSDDGTSFRGTYTVTAGVGTGEVGDWSGSRIGPADTDPPKVKAIPNASVVELDQPTPAAFTVSDDSGKAKWYVKLYSGGKGVAQTFSSGQVPADDSTLTESFPAATPGIGPFYFCVWAEDAAGNRSAGWPLSSCAWVSRQVPLRSVSNGCGAATWGHFWAKVQNWFGDTRSYGGNLVEIFPACNVHDAGYRGVTVRVSRTKIVDFRTWTRKMVDDQFRIDIAAQCRKWLTSAAQKPYLAGCVNGPPLAAVLIGILGVPPTKPGALAYYEAVRKFGKAAFDRDVTTPGTQAATPTSTNPVGGARDGD